MAYDYLQAIAADVHTITELQDEMEQRYAAAHQLMEKSEYFMNKEKQAAWLLTRWYYLRRASSYLDQTKQAQNSFADSQNELACGILFTTKHLSLTKSLILLNPDNPDEISKALSFLEDQLNKYNQLIADAELFDQGLVEQMRQQIDQMTLEDVQKDLGGEN